MSSPLREEDDDVANEGSRIDEAERNGKKFMLKTDNLSKVRLHHVYMCVCLSVWTKGHLA